jgi:hypothetical protein
LVNYTNNLNNLYGYNAYSDQLITNQKNINNVYTDFKNQKIEINLDKVTIDNAIKELTIDMGKAQEHIKAIEQLAKDAAVKETAVDNIGKDLTNTQDNFAKNLNDYNLKYENSLASAAWAESQLYNINNFVLSDEDFFDIYITEKYLTFGEDGFPELGVSLEDINPEVLAMERVGFLIFKNAYKATVLKKLSDIKDKQAEKDKAKSDAEAAAATTSSGGGGGGYSGGGESGGSGSPSGGGFGSGWGGGSGGWGREVIYQAEKGINVYIDDEGQTVVEYE